jgi:hypothetical protein
MSAASYSIEFTAEHYRCSDIDKCFHWKTNVDRIMKAGELSDAKSEERFVCILDLIELYLDAIKDGSCRFWEKGINTFPVTILDKIESLKRAIARYPDKWNKFEKRLNGHFKQWLQLFKTCTCKHPTKKVYLISSNHYCTNNIKPFRGCCDICLRKTYVYKPACCSMKAEDGSSMCKRCWNIVDKCPFCRHSDFPNL